MEFCLMDPPKSNSLFKGNCRCSSYVCRIKHQQDVIEKLRESVDNATKRRLSLRNEIQQLKCDSDGLLAILKARTEFNERSLKAFLVPPPRRTTSDRDSSPSAPSYFQPSNPPDTTIPAPRVRSLLPLKRSYGSANIEVPLVPTASTSTDYLSNQQRVQTLNSSSTSAIPTLGSLGGGASSLRRPGPLHLVDPARPDSGGHAEDDFACVRLDPSVELILSRIKRSLRASEAQITSNQTELQRSKFTQDSQNGKRIMNRIRVLESENEELARQRESGRPARLNCLIALRQDFIARVKSTNENLESLVEESEAETEVFTSTLVVLQQQLGLARTTIEVLGAALGAIEPAKCLQLFSRANWPLPECLSHLVTETASATTDDAAAEEEETKLQSPLRSPVLPNTQSPIPPSGGSLNDAPDPPRACQEMKQEAEEEEEQQTTPAAANESTSPHLLTKMSPSQVDVSKISASPEASTLPLSPSPSPPSVSQPPVSVSSSDIAPEPTGPVTEMPPATTSPSLVTVRPPINELPSPSPYCRDPRILRHRTNGDLQGLNAAVRLVAGLLLSMSPNVLWAEAIPLHRQDAASVTNALLKEWVCRYGAPFSLHSDCGANFESHLLREVCDLLLIHKTRTTPTHPEGNGQVERTNRTIINILKAFAEGHHPHDWDVKLPFAMMAYRAAIHSSTGHAPFYMLTGRQFRLPADSNVPAQQPTAYTTDNYVIELQELLRLTHNLTRTQLRNAYDRQKTYFDRRAHGLPYHIGDLVLRYRAVPPVGTPAKFFHPWEGPFVVTDVISPTTYIIRDALTHAGPTFTVHFDKLKPYHGSLPVASHDTLHIPPPHLVPSPTNEVEVPPDPHPPPGPEDGALPRGGGAVVTDTLERLF
nr:unnamed protein product [Spirometra erinaceieuropaei]